MTAKEELWVRTTKSTLLIVGLMPHLIVHLLFSSSVTTSTGTNLLSGIDQLLLQPSEMETILVMWNKETWYHFKSSKLRTFWKEVLASPNMSCPLLYTEHVRPHCAWTHSDSIHTVNHTKSSRQRTTPTHAAGSSNTTSDAHKRQNAMWRVPRQATEDRQQGLWSLSTATVVQYLLLRG